MEKRHAHRFYCVKCSQLKSTEHAGILFRTGFYRVNHPLGLCGHCAKLSK